MSYVDDPEWEAEVMRRIEKNSISKDERIRELESLLCRVSVAGPTSRLPTALLTDIKEVLEPQR